MSNWFRRFRGALGMGFTWAVGWGLVGFVIEAVQEVVPGWNGALIDIWPAALALPAFLCGVTFSAVLTIAAANRRFDEMSLAGFARWGALGGFVVAIPILGGIGPTAETLTLAAVTSALGAMSAMGSLMIARRAEDRELLEASEEVADVGLSGEEAKELLEG